MGKRAENGASPAAPPQVFAGLRLLDLSMDIAGEYCTKLFADFGATVIKVEPREGSPTRRWQQVGGVSPLYSHLNTNKRSITLDPSTATGASILLELAAHSDGVVESFGTGVLESWGLSWTRLQAIHPALVLTRITAFGLNGPYAQDAATQLSLAAMGSAMNSSGRADREPLQKPGHLVSYSVGNTAAVATLGALWLAQRTHTGQQVDVSALEALAAGTDRRFAWLLYYAYTGENTLRAGATESVLPAGSFPCADGYVTFSILPQMLPVLLHVIGADDLLPLFSDPVHLAEPQAIGLFNERFYPWLMCHTRHEIMTICQEAHLPVLAVYGMGDLLESEHFRSREFWVEQPMDDGRPLQFPGPPWRMEGGWRLRHPAPALGEATVEILSALGWSRQDIDTLYNIKVI